MSELEKLELLKEKIAKSNKYVLYVGYSDLLDLLNIIENQQKEIEEKNIAINKMSKDISRQLEEIDEKSTIIMVGAEKVKQLEKGNRSLMESRIKWKNRYYKEKIKTKLAIEKIDNKYNQEETIPRFKIREKIKELEGHGTFDAVIVLRNLLKED